MTYSNFSLRGDYPYAYDRLRTLLSMAVYDLDHGRPCDRICDELRQVMNEIESDLKGKTVR